MRRFSENSRTQTQALEPGGEAIGKIRAWADENLCLKMQKKNVGSKFSANNLREKAKRKLWKQYLCKFKTKSITERLHAVSWIKYQFNY